MRRLESILVKTKTFKMFVMSLKCVLFYEYYRIFVSEETVYPLNTYYYSQWVQYYKVGILPVFISTIKTKKGSVTESSRAIATLPWNITGGKRERESPTLPNLVHRWRHVEKTTHASDGGNSAPLSPLFTSPCLHFTHTRNNLHTRTKYLDLLVEDSIVKCCCLVIAENARNTKL